MNEPIIICEDSFQIAWARAIVMLKEHKWKAWNVVVQVNAPAIFDVEIDSLLVEFARHHKIITPKHVAHTIFPQTFYKSDIDREQLYAKYWRFFEKVSQKSQKHGWGTYFERMISYNTSSGKIDQLGSIIDNINNRDIVYGAANVMVIPYPHRDRNKIMGAPCLNYITVQVEKDSGVIGQKKINLMAVYRNHDFTKRTYGNYLGLCNLLKYISSETNSATGMLTCVSSHADVPNHRTKLLNIANTILGENNDKS